MMCALKRLWSALLWLALLVPRALLAGLKRLFKPVLRAALRVVRALVESPRRLLSRTLYNEMIGFRDSHLELGEEEVPPHEDELIRRTVELLVRRHRRDYPPGVRPMPRDFHAKAQGCFRAEFELAGDLPAEVRYGVFAAPGGTRFDAVVRFSNASRDQGPDRTPNQHGMAIKLIVGPDGLHQDFLLSDFPVNFIQDVEQSYYFYRADAADRPLAYFVRNPYKFALTLIGSTFTPVRDVFDLRYFSQTPYRLGPTRACKYMAKPVPPPLLPPPPPEVGIGADFLRDRMEARVQWAEEGGYRVCFDFYVQPQRHPVLQPVEDACFEWREEDAAPIRVGRITLLPSVDVPFTTRAARWHAELLAFNPDNAHPDLSPIGGLNRIRRAVYRHFAQMRFEANGVAERTGKDALPPGPPGPPPSP